jgi:protein-tyrosine phosphatase
VSTEPRLRILFVCTANRCRSPLAEAIARAEHGGDGREFASAGLLDSSEPVPSTGIAVGIAQGLDLTGHRSHRVEPTDLAAADVILTMTREQARALVALDPDSRPRVFLLSQAAAWLDANPRPAGTSVAAWIRAEGGSRSVTDLFSSSRRDEIPDPIGGPPRLWRAVIRRLRSELSELSARLD